MNVKDFENRIGYCFQNKSLLQTAFTHSSFQNEHQMKQFECYERLEFLGDSILGLVAAEYLYLFLPLLPEGKMTRIRSVLVCEESLCAAARKLDLGNMMRLGKGEELSNGRERPSILADMLEALIAAIYLDGGINQAKTFIMHHVLDSAAQTVFQQSRDNKTELQEFVQCSPGSTIQYEMMGAEGPDHKKVFTYRVLVDGKEMGTGTGYSKKEAEQAAAGAALLQLRP